MLCRHGVDQLQPELESADYAACTLLLNGLRVQYRVAKITPTKVGQFVTLWKRVGRGPIQPFEVGDPVEVFVVSTRSGPRLGQFVFPKAVLAAQGVVARDDRADSGKRALRVYPPWDTTTSRQAQRTQAWQLQYFVDMSEGRAVDLARVKALLARQGVSRCFICPEFVLSHAESGLPGAGGGCARVDFAAIKILF